MMTFGTFMGFVDGARDAYLKAVKKHPRFTDKVCHHTLETVRENLAILRKHNNDGFSEDFTSIVEEEIAEYIEASILGDTEAAKRELLDCAAVIMREWERLSQ